MDGAEKALTEIAEPVARLFERATGIRVDPALGAALIAMSLILVGALTVVSVGLLVRRQWRRRGPQSRRQAASADLKPATTLPKPVAVAVIAVEKLNDNAPEPLAKIAVPVPSPPVNRGRPTPRPAPNVRVKRVSARLQTARRIRDAVMAHAQTPVWQANPEVPALTTLEVRSIDGIRMRVELMAPEAGAPIYALNIWSDGAKVFNYEWSAQDEKSEKLRYLKAGDWTDDILTWRFAPTLAQAPKLFEAGGA
jgi:hypothetical protein